MVNRSVKIIAFCILMCVLAVPSLAQNTKGDKPTPTRESRFKKTPKKEKQSKRISSKRRTTTSLRAYKPRKKSRGGERAGRPLGPVHNSQPRERPRKIYSQNSIYVNNKSGSQKDSRRNRPGKFSNRVIPKSATGATRNVYPQTGRYVNHSSAQERKPPRKRKVVPRSASRAFIARRSVRAWANFPKQKQKRERAYTKDIAGRRLRTKNFETKRPRIVTVPRGTEITGSPQVRNVYPRTKRIRTSSAKRGRNVYPQSNRYVNNYLRQPKRLKTVSNGFTLSRLNKLQASHDRKPGRKRKVVPRSASRAFIARKSPNTWAHFPRPKRKGEKAITTDIAGKPLRTKNYETKRPRVLINPTARPYTSKIKLGDKPYRGKRGGYVSATRSGKAWRGDITNRRIRKNYSSKRGFEGKPVLTPEKRRVGMRNQGEGYSGNIRGGKNLRDQGEEYSGTFKRRRPLKGGGSISGRTWNNQGQAVPVRPPGLGRGAAKYQGNIRFGGKSYRDQGEEFSGNMKARRPLKGGGSVSGRTWNNQGQAVPVRTPGLGRDAGKYQGNIRFGGKHFRDQGEEFSGNLKTRRPDRGGGSVSGKLWNNKQTPVAVRTPTEAAARAGRYSGNIRAGQRAYRDQGEEFTGNIKSKRPLKGGGSVSGKLWNNKQTAIAVRIPTEEAARAGRFSGSIKSKRPLKGGGRVSGKLWNNKQTAIAVRTPTEEAARAGRFSGNIKSKRPLKGGGSVSGKLWNNKETPIRVREPSNYQGEESTASIKLRRGYRKTPNSADEALKVRKPRTLYETDGLQIKVRRPEYVNRRNAPDGSLPVLKPNKTSIKAGEYTRGIKSYKYVRNSNSSDYALKVRETGKAFARAADYQGNIKMKKFDLFGKRGLHPDAQFVKINKNNVAGEKDAVTNFKLWWARLFKKSDTQPDHLKDKRGKPRYDKGEAGLWYD